MCLTIPMMVTRIDGLMAEVEAKGVKRQANLLFIQHEELSAGDFVMVHAGNVISKTTREEADQVWLLLDEVLAVTDRSQQVSHKLQ